MKHFMRLTEDNRQQLLSRARSADREKTDKRTRYQKRVRSRVSTNVSQYNKMNMNLLFKEGIVSIGINVTGETDNYVVLIKFGGFLDELQRAVKNNNYKLEFKLILRSLVTILNRGDVYIGCNCPDFRYRLAYHGTKNNIIAGLPETRPSDITNPNDTLGPGCKHIMCVLANTDWIMKVTSVINNYIKYMEQHMERQYADIIFPAVYGMPYDKAVQLNLFDTGDDLESGEDTLDQSNAEARGRARFKPGNPWRFKKKPEEEDPNQVKLQLDDEEQSEEPEEDNNEE